MAAEMANQHQMRNSVLYLTMAEQERGTDPLTWAARLSSNLAAAGVSVPSVEVAELLVSHICWSNNVPIAWKFLEKALTHSIVPPLFVIALLSTRVISSRRRYPVAYRLYMVFVKRYALSMPLLINGPNYHKIMESIADVLQFRQMFGAQSSEPGHIVVEFIFSALWELLDASLDDECLLEYTLEKKSRWPIKSEDMEIESLDGFEGKNMERRVALSKMNTLMAVEIIGEFFQSKVISRILYLVRRNMPKHWGCFIQHLRVLIANSSSLRNSKNITPEGLLAMSSDSSHVLTRAIKMSIMAMNPMPSSVKCNGTVHSALWLPIDLYLEDAMDVNKVCATSAAETLTGLVKALKVLYQTTWHDAFLGLWTASLRLVQRERNSVEGPERRLNNSLCILLSITALTVVNIVEEEEVMLIGEGEQSSISQRKHSEPVGKLHEDLVSCLQRLGGFEGLLIPPPLVSSLAHQAAAKAIMSLYGVSVDMTLNCAGNLWHLIVEACIARNVLNTSAYMWPGYVKGGCSQIPQNIFGQTPVWSSFMKGSPLTPPMIIALVSTPATSLAEIERMNEIAVSGTDDERISAATILCGASLLRGWNIQEHTGLLITNLLSPAVPKYSSECGSHLLGYAPFFNVLTVGISSVDCIQIFSLHGLVPRLASALMPICEVFGYCAPNMSWTLNTGEEISSRTVFSNAFILLLKLWSFDQPPLNHVMGDGAPVRSHATLDHLLLVHNFQLASYEKLRNNQNKTSRLSRLLCSSSRGPIFMDSFPKLKRWHRRHQECISSVISSLVPESTVREIIEVLLSMMFRKLSKGQPLTPTTSDESNLRTKFPAWDILEAVPFVLDATFTACAHDRLPPRELITGLKDLADFLPASLATIISYCSAEVSRSLWKPALLNGIDWPSPLANLSMVEEMLKEILVATGVSVPLPATEASPTLTVPLHLAALIGLTITYQLDRDGESHITFVGPAIEYLATRCSRSCMSIMAALWTQKAKHWTDFLVLKASQAIFHHNDDAIVQLLRSCFATALSSGVGSLLGHGLGSQFSGDMCTVTPGTLYIRAHLGIRNVMLVTEEIVSLLMESVKDISKGMVKLKNKKYVMKCGHVSLAVAMSKVKTAASLGASLVWITGGLHSLQLLFIEILPSWFMSTQGQESSGVCSLLSGYALAYFIVFCGLFAWGGASASALPVSKSRRKVLGRHFEFLASALEGRISLGCSEGMWRAYVTGYLSLIIEFCSEWMVEVDGELVKRVCKVLNRWNKEEMVIALLGISGFGAMGFAAEMILENEF